MLVQVRWETNKSESHVLRSSFKTIAEALDRLVPKTVDVRTVSAMHILNPEDTARLFSGPAVDKPPGA